MTFVTRALEAHKKICRLVSLLHRMDIIGERAMNDAALTSLDRYWSAQIGDVEPR